MSIVTGVPAHAPDHIGEIALDAVPGLLITEAATYAGAVEGDAPSVRVPYVVDGSAAVVAEGNAIPDSEPEPAEVVVKTSKVAALAVVSRELYLQNGAAGRFATSLQRSVVNKGNAGFVGSLKTASAEFHDGGTLSGSDLDALGAAVTDVEANGGQASHMFCSAGTWNTLAAIKQATDSAMPLVGVGNVSEAPERRLFGCKVVVSNAMDDASIYVVSKADLVAAYSPIALAVSHDAYFSTDSVGLRATFRQGIEPARGDRHALVTVGSAG